MTLTPAYLRPTEVPYDTPAPQYPTPSTDNPVPNPITTGGTPTAVNTTVTSVVPDPSYPAPPNAPAGTLSGTPTAVGTWLPSVGNNELLPAYAGGTTYAINQVVGYVASDSSTRVAATYAGGTTYALGAQVIYNGVLYTSLHAGNVGNEPDTSPSKWQVSDTSYNPATSYSTTQQVLKGGVLYVCVIATTSTEPGVDTTDWTASTVAGAWAIGTTYAAGNIVTYLSDYYLSLVGSNTGNVPGATASEAFWTKIIAPAWDTHLSYPAGAYVTLAGTLYIAANATVSVDPRVANNLQSPVNTPSVVNWDVLGYGLQAAYQSKVNSNTGNQPDTATADWALIKAGNGDASREGAIVDPALQYQAGSESEVWNTSNYFTGSGSDSTLTRQDFSNIVATIAVSPSAPSFAHTTTQQLTITVKDNNGNTLTPGQRGVPALSVVSVTTAHMTADNNGLLTGVAAGTSVITVSCGGRSTSITATCT